MARFIFTAKSAPGRQITGSIDAESEIDAINKISRTGYFPVSLRREASAEQSAFSAAVTRAELVVFTRELSNLIGAGINVLNSLTLIQKETHNPKFRRILADITTAIKDGKSFSESLALYPRLFNDIYRAMIKTGESSGNLKAILYNLSTFLEADAEFKESVLSALIYPFFVIAVGIITVIVLLIFVVPGLITMFSDMGQALPLPTQMLIAISAFTVRYGLAAVIASIAAWVFLKYIFSTPKGKLAFDKFKLNAGILGDITFKAETGRLLRSLSLLLSSGIIITVALERASTVTANSYLRRRLGAVIDKVRAGARFSHAMKSLSLFPESMLNIVAVGEETGSLDASLRHIADEYEREVSRTLKVFTRILEPVVILLVGLVVAFIVAMLLPIFEINFLVR